MLLISEAADGNNGGFLLLCLASLTIDGLHLLRPINMNDPEGFYPSESDEPFWKIRRDMFKDIFRFRMEQVHRLISASVFLLRYGIGLWNSVALALRDF